MRTRMRATLSRAIKEQLSAFASSEKCQTHRAMNI